jgi:hypothetical protein
MFERIKARRAECRADSLNISMKDAGCQKRQKERRPGFEHEKFSHEGAHMIDW